MTNRDAILEHLVDLKNGTIALVGEVNDEMYAYLVMCLMAFRSAEKPIEKLTFILNTYGGDLYQALAIYDLIKQQEMHTVIICNGPVMSAGTVILQAANERVMTKRSYLMFHFGTQTADSAQCLAHFNALTADIKEVYKERCKVTPRVMSNWFEKDTYYNAAAALKHTLIDRIADYEEKDASKDGN